MNKATLKVLASRQLPSGQFPTVVQHEPTGLRQEVHTLTPTYLICLLLQRVRESSSSCSIIDRIISNGLSFLERCAYLDPIAGLRVWHFNAFYPPDWEETCWISLMLYEAGRISRKDLEMLRSLLAQNESPDKGVGVWIKDPYTPGNSARNSFDPVVSLVVSEWLQRVFNEVSEPTEAYLQRTSDQPSLYYHPAFKNYLFWLLGKRERPDSLEHEGDGLFHNSSRKSLWYGSPDVWEACELTLAL